MEIKFEIVRVGKFRRDSLAERFIKENVALMKKSIRSLLEDFKYMGNDDKMELTLVIPAKGDNIKIYIGDRKDENFRKILRQNFPDSIYKGNDSIIEENIHNPIFPFGVI